MEEETLKMEKGVLGWRKISNFAERNVRIYDDISVKISHYKYICYTSTVGVYAEYNPS